MTSRLCTFVAIGLLAAPAAFGQLEMKIAPFEGAHRLFNRPVEGRGATDPILLRLTLKAQGDAARQVAVKLSADDIFGNPVSWKSELSVDLPAGKSVEQYVPFFAGPGYFEVHAEASAGEEKASAVTDLGVVPPPWPGVRPDSLFASNTAGVKDGEDMRLLQAIGMKVERAHFLPRLAVKNLQTWARETAPGQPPAFDFPSQDKLWAQTRAAGLWVLPVVGYALPGDLNEMAIKTGMYGPPADYQRFVNAYLQILNHYPEITTVEFWNEPWIYGWNFAGTPTEYRDLQKQFCQAMLKIRPGYRIVAGNSTMFVTDNIEPDPSCWRGLLSGITHHPYDGSVGGSTFRPGDHARSMDETGLLARRMNLPFAYLTEGGTMWAPMFDPACIAVQNRLAAAKARLAEIDPASPQREAAAREVALLADRVAAFGPIHDDIYDARKIVQYYVRAAVTGMFQANAQWEIGYGPGWTRANTTFGFMTHELEDRPPLAEIWPENELLFGGIFANPSQVTPEVNALPRAREISQRWGVPIPNDRADDQTKVAVIWCQTGKSNIEVDTEGTLTIASPAGLRAYDMSGRPIQPGPHGLTVPFTEAPVYITTDALSVIELRNKIASARIEHVTPVNLYALSLEQDASQRQELGVRIENQLNRPIDGILRLTDGHGLQQMQAFSLAAGRLGEVKIQWPGVKASAENQYGVTLTAEIAPPEGWPAKKQEPGHASGAVMSVTRQQILSVARFVKRTITIDGKLDDWQGVAPVLLDSDQLQGGVDPSQYLLNPHLDAPTASPAGKRIVARVYTAYDDANVYLAAAVNEDEFKCTAGEPVVKGRRENQVTLPWKNGLPGGLNHITLIGDAFQFSFGFRDRVPGYGRQMDDVWAWKGEIYDADYDYVAHASTEGDKLIRIWGADTARRDGYQTEPVPGLEAVPEGRIKISRDEEKKLTIYELAIPRAELRLFDPSAGRCRFSFVLHNSEKVGDAGLNWSDAAGVFDHWRTHGSFPPLWIARTACESFFSIEK